MANNQTRKTREPTRVGCWLSLGNLRKLIRQVTSCSAYFSAGEAEVFQTLHNHLLRFAGREGASNAAIKRVTKTATVDSFNKLDSFFRAVFPSRRQFF